MLDTDTKRRIDTARDLLVGKVPDPKSQVEQITIALIYKFMDDMDAEAEELGGKRKFFSGEYGKFGWAKLMQPGIGGHELLALYADGIAKMPENPGIPALFRDIFKNAYLPYRDPETLKSFLKVINEFSYDHSERLGDAFEYLLSVLGSQGDAGQFRTPRHIIDFIVEILAPRKEEVLLDPSCGTAGFLISAYKHILRSNTDAQGHNTLTPQQRGEMAKNFKGYDISPDMVRLSLVNLYLHGFTDPHIFEYDTLTDVARWNEFADVILANPPFMSPKGGIRPHNRFSIQAKRSEVLFVDYIAEHLTPNGRAGIIVPEGIIFQSQNAYKDLRKMLVENSLVAVISLPAGCFNPYSGVKTSILLLDKSLARKSQTVAFFKVENDGYDLGAQRRPIQKNDLPKVQEELETYLATLRERKDPSGLALTTALIVPKEKIAANGDYKLSGENYRQGTSRASHFQTVPLGDVCDLIGGATPSKQDESFWTNGSVKWISSKHIHDDGTIKGFELITPKAVEESSTRVAPKNSTIIITRVSVGKFAFADDDYAINQDLTAIVSKDPGTLSPDYIRVVARHISEVVERNAEGIGVRGVTRSFLGEIEIPLPPLEIQREIVAEIEGYQKVINGARSVLDNYHPHIPINPTWPTVELEEVCEVRSGGTPSRSENSYWNGNIPWVGSAVCKDGEVTKAEEFITEEGLNNSAAKLFPKDTTLIALVGATIGKTALLKFESTTNQNIAGIYPKSRKTLDSIYLFHAAQQLYSEFMKLGEGKFRMANLSFVREQKIPLPPLAEQQAIVAEIEAEQNLVNANRELITRFEAKIQTTLSRIWGDESSIS